MLIFNCTKASAEFFTSTKKGKKQSAISSTNENITDEPDEQPHWQWLVHAIKEKDKNILIVMDYQSRFSITLPNLKKGDGTYFVNNFEQQLITHANQMMAAINTDLQTIKLSLEHYHQKHNSHIFFQRGDRSIQAHINDVAWHFCDWIYEEGAIPTGNNLINFDYFANQMLRKRKGDKDYFIPQHQFLSAWLKNYAKYSAAKINKYIDILKLKERADFEERHKSLILQSE